MKRNNILKSLAAALFGCLMAASCQPDDPQGGNGAFPEYKEYTVAPGESVEISFNAQTSWEISVPDNTLQWFWIQDGSFQLYRLKGKAGSHTVVIGVSDKSEFDNDRTCIVKMTIEGETKEIAKITRPSEYKTLSVLAAQVVDGELQYMEDGSSYLYTEEEPESLDLFWSGSEFRLPIRVEANFNWLYEGPEWLRMDVPSNAVGVRDVTIYGVPEAYPLDDETSVLKFMAGNILVKEIEVRIPGCKGLFSYHMEMNLTDIQFNFKGQYKIATGFTGGDDAPEDQMRYPTGKFSGTSGVRVLTLSKDDAGYSTEAPSWLTVMVDEYDASEGAPVLQERSFTIRADVNEGDNREAAVFILPPTVTVDADGLFDATGIKEEFTAYMIPVLQLSSDQEYVSLVENPSDVAAAGASLTVSQDAGLLTMFGQARYAYELVYLNRYAMDKARIMFTSPFSDYKVFDEEKNEIVFEKVSKYTEALEIAKTSEPGLMIDVLDDEVNGDGSKYLAGLYQVTSSGTLAKLDYADHFLLSVSAEEDRMSAVIDMKAEKVSVGYVVLYGESGNVLAVIKCTLDPQAVIGEVAEIKFVGSSVNDAVTYGATLEYITDEEDELYKTYSKEGGCPIFHLTYTQKNHPMTVSLPSSALSYCPNPFQQSVDVFNINGVGFYDTYPVGSFKRVEEGGVSIHMNIPDGEDYRRCALYFYSVDNGGNGSNETLVLIMVCTIDLR